MPISRLKMSKQLKGNRMSPGEKKAKLGSDKMLSSKTAKLARARKNKGRLNLDDMNQAKASIIAAAKIPGGLAIVERELKKFKTKKKIQKEFSKKGK
jgi:hypothetical protein